jgi:hypothetical protein
MEDGNNGRCQTKNKERQARVKLEDRQNSKMGNRDESK